jgi:hypothetical protein
MTQIWDCTDARLPLGVYVLGAIDPAERALVDAHLVTCQDCRDELAGLAGLPALLARVNPDEISRICADDTVRAGAYAGADDRPPGELIGTVLNLAEARRRRTRWRFLATAAAAVAIGGPVRRAELDHDHADRRSRPRLPARTGKLSRRPAAAG